MHRPTSTDEVVQVVRDAAARRASLRVQGQGTWLDAGLPVRADEVLALDRLRGVVAYTPADLTITVEAATTLGELDAATGAHGQWCPLFPWGDDAGTVGATVATATAGPFAGRLGRPRDLVLGVDAVDGVGRAISAGGRVVKNVAGFDLTRALTGSWGTLAVLTRLHLRLQSRPAVDETWAITMGGGMSRALREFARGPYAPLAALELSHDDAGALGLARATGALVRIGGNRDFVTASIEALRVVGLATAVGSGVWDHVRARLAPADRARTWRWDVLSLRLRERFDPARVLNPGLLGDTA